MKLFATPKIISNPKFKRSWGLTACDFKCYGDIVVQRRQRRLKSNFIQFHTFTFYDKGKL